MGRKPIGSALNRFFSILLPSTSGDRLMPSGLGPDPPAGCQQSRLAAEGCDAGTSASGARSQAWRASRRSPGPASPAGGQAEQQQRRAPEGDDHRLIVDREHSRAWLCRAGGSIGDSSSLRPLGNRLRVDPLAARQRPQTRLAMPDRATERLCRGRTPVENHGPSRILARTGQDRTIKPRDQTAGA